MTDTTATITTTAMFDIRSVLTELLRLYDLRKELAAMEKALNARVTRHVGGADDPALADGLDSMRRLLLQYGREKKAAWEAARRVLLADPMARDIDGPMIMRAAAAIANARAGRRGAPPITNVLEILPPKLFGEVIDDAKAALAAAWERS